MLVFAKNTYDFVTTSKLKHVFKSDHFYFLVSEPFEVVK